VIQGKQYQKMANLRTGIDMVEIERFEAALRRHGTRFLARVFTAQELAEVGQNTASLAARFAAKEAAAKALGTGIGSVTWQEIEILRGPAREPTLCLHGAAVRLAQSLDLGAWSVSLSHTRTHAVAVVVLQGSDAK
jgi:holo-[acyl-carrier protein] synthase